MPPLMVYRTAPRTHLFRRALLLSVIISFSAVLRVVSQAPDEDQVKAVFIYNFTSFVKWPAPIFKNSDAPFIIGIMGDAVGQYLEEIVKGETVNDHTIQVKYLTDLKEVPYCNIIFIEKSYRAHVHKIITDLNSKPILTVGDDDNFIKDGGMIRLYTAENKIRIEINEHQSKAANLDISVKLLRLATVLK